MVRFSTKLNVKLLVSFVCLWIVIFFFFFIFLLNPISDFIRNHIQHNMEWLANSAYSIGDNSLGDLINSAIRAYLAIAGILLTSMILILFFDNIVVKDRINKIIAPLKKNHKPHSRGKAESECFSKDIEQMLESLHRAKHDLEQRVEEQTNELQQAQEQLRRLSGNIMANLEIERTAIARELHDELGQALTVLRMDAYWLKEQLQKAGIQGVERAAAMCSLIDSTGENMHNLAIRMRPGVLDNLGLVDALEWYTCDYQRRTQIPCTFRCDEIHDIDEILATAAYRIAQEALTNVARHANAAQVEVDLNSKDNDLVLTVSDDGCGFNERPGSETEELGLLGMRERAALVGGILTVDSKPGKGTRICFRVRVCHQSMACLSG